MYMPVCMYVPVCLFLNSSLCVCMCVQAKELHKMFLSIILILFLRQCLLLNLKQTNLTILVDHQVLGILLSLPSQCQDPKHIHHTSYVCVQLKSDSRCHVCIVGALPCQQHLSKKTALYDCTLREKALSKVSPVFYNMRKRRKKRRRARINHSKQYICSKLVKPTFGVFIIKSSKQMNNWQYSEWSSFYKIWVLLYSIQTFRFMN